MPDTAAVTPTDHVALIDRCPRCGVDCTWNGVYGHGGGTKYVISCQSCPKQVLR